VPKKRSGARYLLAVTQEALHRFEGGQSIAAAAAAAHRLAVVDQRLFNGVKAHRAAKPLGVDNNLSARVAEGDQLPAGHSGARYFARATAAHHPMRRARTD
jgi:hypothetical protein